jgi:hypothetical protein
MPAPLRPCAGGCGALVRKGRCPACSRVPEQARGTSTERGYGAAWQAFRPQFIGMLVNAGITPVCGAALPDGPSITYSRCRDAGIETWRSGDGSDLHIHHDPPLLPWERTDTARVCDPLRVGLLCRECHSSETPQTSKFSENREPQGKAQDTRSKFAASFASLITRLTSSLQRAGGGVFSLPIWRPQTIWQAEKPGCAHRGENAGARFGGLDFA